MKILKKKWKVPQIFKTLKHLLKIAKKFNLKFVQYLITAVSGTNGHVNVVRVVIAIHSAAVVQ